MKPLFTNIIYKLKYQLPWYFWYMGIYLLSISLLYGILIKTGIINACTGSLSYRLWGSGFFLFAISLRFKEDFDLFLTLGNSRKIILLSFTGAAVVEAAVIALMITIEKVIMDVLNRQMLLYVKDFFHTLAPYRAPRLLYTFLFFMSLSIFISMFAILISSLSYRFGNKFTWGFWLSLTLLPVIVVPAAIGFPGDLEAMGIFLRNIGEFLKSFNILRASGWLILLSAAAGTGAFLNIRFLEMK